MDHSILFVGQCKQGSNSLFEVLSKHSRLTSGRDIRAMVRKSFTDQEYFSNWKDIDTSQSLYLLDKSIINPSKYDYHVGNWQNYNHKMIYMIRNVYNVLKSQFLVVLAGEASYQYCIPKFGKTWLIDDKFSEKDVLEIMDYNVQKYTHLKNIINLPKDVFDISKNVHFCTFESFKDDTENEFKKLESFLEISLDAKIYPKKNSTAQDWYASQADTYEQNVKLFEKWKDFIYEIFVSKTDYEQLSEITGIDFISLYNIK